MSDEQDPKPMKKTSAVPLRKETVRVTLKSTPDGSKAPDAPKVGAPKPPAPAPTIPLKTAGPGTAKPSVPAPTVQLQTGQATTKPATPAPTVKLNTPASTSGPGTVPLATGGGSSQPLPKATVQLQQTQPMEASATPSQAATIRTAEEDDAADAKTEVIVSVLSIAALVIALVVFGLQLGTASIWVHDAPQNPGWAQLFE